MKNILNKFKPETDKDYTILKNSKGKDGNKEIMFIKKNGKVMPLTQEDANRYNLIKYKYFEGNNIPEGFIFGFALIRFRNPEQLKAFWCWIRYGRSHIENASETYHNDYDFYTALKWEYARLHPELIKEYTLLNGDKIQQIWSGGLDGIKQEIFTDFFEWTKNIIAKLIGISPIELESEVLK